MSPEVSLLDNQATLTTLQAVDWDFVSAQTGYLTHNLHPYPAKFIPQIPSTLIQELSSAGETVADIFCGSGTTLLEALRLNRNAIGIDANPIATLISQAKTTLLSEADRIELKEHMRACTQVIHHIQSPLFGRPSSSSPFKSAGWRPAIDFCEFWFLPHVVEELAEVRLLIDSIHSASAKLLCTVALSAILVRVSKQDSDTRYVRRNKRILPSDTIRHYLNHLNSMTSATQELAPVIGSERSCTVVEANLLDAPETDQFDLVVTSPPYPNAYSYHLYHRTRLVWLGYDPSPFKQIEIGSHRKYSQRGRARATPATFHQEFKTIFEWLRGRLRNGRHACFVIGNSTIRGARIDCGSIIATAGLEVGFREVARFERSIASKRKAFNPTIGKIKTEDILILQKA